MAGKHEYIRTCLRKAVTVTKKMQLATKWINILEGN